MRPSSRRPVNKAKSAQSFRRQVGRVKAANITPSLGLARGGWRL